MADSNPIRSLESQNSDSSPVRCGRCGTLFQCGMNNADKLCWCTAFPHAMPLPREDTACYCPACLAVLVGPVASDR